MNISLNKEGNAALLAVAMRQNKLAITAAQAEQRNALKAIAKQARAEVREKRREVTREYRRQMAELKQAQQDIVKNLAQAISVSDIEIVNVFERKHRSLLEQNRLGQHIADGDRRVQ
jgi:Spy/CpxP family protein refolding chaperone